MNNLEYLSFTQIDKICLHKKLVLFGAGTISEKLCKRLRNSPSLIVDNSSNLWGELQDGVRIDSPDKLRSYKPEKVFIIICSTSYSEIKGQLIGYGFFEKVDFTISPLLKDIFVIFELESLTKEIVFTSGSPKTDNPSFGGGIYKLSLEADNWKYEKKFSGHTYGILEKDGHLIMTDANEGIFVFDADFGAHHMAFYRTTTTQYGSHAGHAHI